MVASPLPRAFSTYLDLLRAGAALAVFFAHLSYAEFTGGIVATQFQIGRAAVIVFFVLSGYVISYVASERERSLSVFAVSRLARVYSVALGAFALTVAVDLLTLAMAFPRDVPLYQYQGWWKYFPLFLSFSAEVGPFHEEVLSNGVFWSLCYEVWFYVAFAAAVFYRGWRRVVLLAVILGFMGERVLIEFPIWIMGALIYRVHRTCTISAAVARLLFAVSIAGLIGLRASGLDSVINEAVNAALDGYPQAHLHASKPFATDYVVGILAALNVFAARYCALSVIARPAVRRAIVYAASFTFSLYLTHRPFMYLFLMVDYDPASPVRIGQMVVGVLASVWLFGLATEHKKHVYRRFFFVALDGARSLLVQRAPAIYHMAESTPAPALVPGAAAAAS
jgi:peptidoglycan/LPS O-acetylase OafA/YrhL